MASNSRIEPKPRKPAGPTRLKRVALALVGLVLAIALGELLLRMTDPLATAEVLDREAFSAAVLERDERGVLRLRPGARGTLFGHEAVINANGLRNDPVAVPKPAGVRRVLVIGDSVAFGWGVAEADCFPRALERELNAVKPESVRRVEVVNAGVPGWGVPNYLEWLEQRGLALEPDVVVVTLINNDLTDVIEVLQGTSGSAPEPPSRICVPAVLAWSYLARAAVDATNSLIGSGGGQGDFFLDLEMVPEDRAKAAELVCGAFERMRALCGDVPFAVIDTVGSRDGQRLEEFVACANDRGIVRIEAYPGDDYRGLYAVGRTDDHPNAAGHRFLAERTISFVRTALR